MDDPRFAIWNTLHDGELEALTREGSDILVMRISIPYLRSRMTPSGDAFCLRLGGFRSATFAPWEPSDSSSSLEDIARRRLWLLDTNSRTMPVEIATTTGDLTLDFDSLGISLDSGEPVTYDEVLRVCEEYWDEWSAKHKQV